MRILNVSYRIECSYPTLLPNFTNKSSEKKLGRKERIAQLQCSRGLNSSVDKTLY